VKIEVGKSYKSRCGKTYTVTTFNGHTYGYGCVSAMWYSDGNCLWDKSPHRDDLIEEIKECNMEFLTTGGICPLDNRPLRVGDAVRFSDHSYHCYTTLNGMKQDSQELRSGILLATDCKLPFMAGASGNTQHNDAIVFINDRTYFTRLAFLKRA
jgi:hypothetical protein